MEFVMGLCHDVTVLHQGRTLVSGDPDQVRSDPAVLDAYLGGGDDDDV
jgi:ABC-type branched-subunit amino acid transport system ATPase component